MSLYFFIGFNLKISLMRITWTVLSELCTNRTQLMISHFFVFQFSGWIPELTWARQVLYHRASPCTFFCTWSVPHRGPTHSLQAHSWILCTFCCSDENHHVVGSIFSGLLLGWQGRVAFCVLNLCLAAVLNSPDGLQQSVCCSLGFLLSFRAIYL